MDKKNRRFISRGNSHGRAKLSETDIQAIRQSRKLYKTRTIDLARQFKVSPGTINFILQRKTWKEVI